MEERKRTPKKINDGIPDNDARIKKRIEKMEKAKIKRKHSLSPWMDTVKEIRGERSKRVEDYIKEHGGLMKVAPSFLAERFFRKWHADAVVEKWELNNERLIERLDFEDLPPEEKFKLIEKGIRQSIEDGGCDKGVSKEIMNEFVGYLLEHEKNWDKSHNQKVNRSNLSPLEYGGTAKIIEKDISVLRESEDDRK